ncbi:MAG: hypothetical protein OXD40_00130 [bacterium]|nr:hypothetical protein [bacterium]
MTHSPTVAPAGQLELWNGARGEQEQKALQEFARTLAYLDVDDPGPWPATWRGKPGRAE